MPSTSLLAAKLRADFPQYAYAEAEEFRWSPSENTVYFCLGNDTPALLHELASVLQSDVPLQLLTP